MIKCWQLLSTFFDNAILNVNLANHSRRCGHSTRSKWFCLNYFWPIFWTISPFYFDYIYMWVCAHIRRLNAIFDDFGSICRIKAEKSRSCSSFYECTVKLVACTNDAVRVIYLVYVQVISPLLLLLLHSNNLSPVFGSFHFQFFLAHHKKIAFSTSFARTCSHKMVFIRSTVCFFLLLLFFVCVLFSFKAAGFGGVLCEKQLDCIY